MGSGRTSTPKPTATLSVLGIAHGGLELATRAPTLLMPIESATARIGNAGSDMTIDRSSFALLPRGARVTLRPSVATLRICVLAFHEPLVASVVRAYRPLGLARTRLEGWLATEQLLPRTVWMHEIVHRYVFERHALGQPDNIATRFLEMEILKEVYFLLRDREEGAERATIQHRHSAPVLRAVSYIEAHLFESCNVAALARHAGTSDSSLLRAFHRELGVTPAAYWRRRKLDGALDLLRTGSQTVAEIAEVVGYDNATAFGHAFRLRFGQPPSAFRPRKPLRPAP